MISTLLAASVQTGLPLSGSADQPVSGSLIIVMLLLVLVVQKEVVSATSVERWHAMSRGLTIAIAPLIVMFLMILASRALAGVR